MKTLKQLIIPDVKSWRDDKESAATSPKTFKRKVNELRQKKKSESVSCSVMSNPLQPHGLYPTRILCPWDSPGKNTGVGNHSFL